MNKYYSYVLKKQINLLDLKKEPGLNEIKSLLFKKFQRRVLKISFKKITYINPDILDTETKKVISKIEKYLINN